MYQDMKQKVRQEMYQDMIMPKESLKKEALSAFCEEWSSPANGGSTNIRCFYVYPGIVLKRNCVHAPAIAIPREENYSRLKMNFCLNGRCEVPIDETHFVYLEPSRINFDLRQPEQGCIFPGGFYEGLELIIDLPALEKSLPAVLTEFGIDVPQEVRRLAAKNGSRVFTANDSLKQSCNHIYTALSDDSTVPTLQEGRFYAVNLLYHALHCGADSADRTRYVSAKQRRMAVAAHRYLLEHEEHPCSVLDLAKQFDVSATALENCFQAVYGAPIHVYLQNRRMDKARSLLEGTALPVSEIARMAGYSHPGKFAAAFRKRTGMTPLEYRRNHAE